MIFFECPWFIFIVLIFRRSYNLSEFSLTVECPVMTPRWKINFLLARDCSKNKSKRNRNVYTECLYLQWRRKVKFIIFMKSKENLKHSENVLKETKDKGALTSKINKWCILKNEDIFSEYDVKMLLPLKETRISSFVKVKQKFLSTPPTFEHFSFKF